MDAGCTIASYMDVYELKMKHVLSIPICALLSDSSSDLVTAWFSNPEFSAKGLAVRFNFRRWDRYRRRDSAMVEIAHEDIKMLNKTQNRPCNSSIDCMAAAAHLSLNFFEYLPFYNHCSSFSTGCEQLSTPKAAVFKLDKPLDRSVLEKKAASELQKGNSLVVTIEVTLILPKEEPSSPSLPACNPQLSASETLQKMLSERLHPDVQLQLQDGVLPAHRAVLAACSPVFRAMFQHDMKERRSGQVDLRDVPLDAMEAAMQFMYGGELMTSRDPELWMQLLALADCYELTPLKALCEATLCAWVTEVPSDMLRLLVLADQHDAPDLRRTTLSRFSTRMRGKKLDKDALDLIKNHPSLAKDLFEFLLK